MIASYHSNPPASITSDSALLSVIVKTLRKSHRRTNVLSDILEYKNRMAISWLYSVNKNQEGKKIKITMIARSATEM